MTGKEERQQLWQERLATFKESGQSVRAWCSANDMKEHQLRYWLKKDRPAIKKPVSKWMTVEVDEHPIMNKSELSITIGQATIHVKPGFDPNLLRDLVKALTI